MAGGALTKTSEILDLHTNEWRYGPDLPVTTDLWGARTVQYGDTFLIVGGAEKDTGETNTIIKFEIINGRFCLSD